MVGMIDAPAGTPISILLSHCTSVKMCDQTINGLLLVVLKTMTTGKPKDLELPGCGVV